MGHLSVVVLAAVFGAALCCVSPDCDHPDCGSCGNACCLIDFMFISNFCCPCDPPYSCSSDCREGMKSDDVYNAIVENLKKGGDDMRYTYVNSTDYRSDNISAGVKYQLQAIHRTLTYHYNDTLDMLVISKDPAMTTVRAFSISRIEGAYCDDGQNYKNLVGFVKGLGTQFMQKVMFGCTKNPF